MRDHTTSMEERRPRGARAAAAALLVAALAVPGCVVLAAAAVGAGVVAATSEDTAQVDLDAPVDDVTTSAREILESRGNVEDFRADSGLVEGKVDGSRVRIRVFPMEELTRVRVTARKLGEALPDLDLAEDLAGRIARRHL